MGAIQWVKTFQNYELALEDKSMHKTVIPTNLKVVVKWHYIPYAVKYVNLDRQIHSRANASKMTERLRRIPNLLARNVDLFREHTQMIREREDVVKVSEGVFAQFLEIWLIFQMGF